MILISHSDFVLALVLVGATCLVIGVIVGAVVREER